MARKHSREAFYQLDEPLEYGRIGVHADCLSLVFLSNYFVFIAEMI
jgi:hypothetical protein